MKNKIEFIPINLLTEKIIDPPSPASKNIPDWYKNLGMHLTDIKNHKHPNGGSNLTARSCAPVFDALTSGYMMTLPCDLNFVDPKIYGHRVNWDVSWNCITEHTKEQVSGLGVPEGFEKSPLKFQCLWTVKVPRGYSLLYTHPFYRFDLPFITATGIVDADKYEIALNLPFFIKKDFFGILEKGTPIAQLIPIKRETWSSSIAKYNSDQEFNLDKLKMTSFRSYKKNLWSRKQYK